jgi:hypothetical protein
MAPPLPFAYLGKKLEGGQWEVYLGRGEEVLFIVREGMIWPARLPGPGASSRRR